MVAVYDREGIRFAYPENWVVSDEAMEAPVRVVMLQSPGTAFWTLAVHPDDKGPRTVAAEALRMLRDEYDDVEYESMEETWESVEVVGYDIHFFYIEMLVACRLRAFRSAGRTWLVWWQAEDREFESIEEVFRAMSTSVLRASRGQAPGV